MKTNLSTIENSECQLHYEPDSGVLSDGILSTQICAKDHEKLRDTCQVGLQIIILYLKLNLFNFHYCNRVTQVDQLLNLANRQIFIPCLMLLASLPLASAVAPACLVFIRVFLNILIGLKMLPIELCQCEKGII